MTWPNTRETRALQAFGAVVAKFDPAIFALHWPTLVAALRNGAPATAEQPHREDAAS